MPDRQQGLLEPYARTTRTYGSEGAGAQQCAPATRLLSPLLANIALSVLDEHFAEVWQTHMASRVDRARRRRHGQATYKLVRYADDFVVMIAGNQAHAEHLKTEVAEVLAGVGLRLSAETARCRRSKQGTNKPLSDLLRQLNPVLRGWTNYFRHALSKATFGYLHQYTWLRVVGWLRRKHRRANWKTLRRRYLTQRWWPEHDGTALFDCRAVPVTRYRYRGTAIPTPWNGSTTKTA